MPPPPDPGPSPRRGRLGRAVLLLVTVVVVAAVALGLYLGARPLPQEPAPAPPSPSPTTSATPRPDPLAGLHVVLDPGHNGRNAAATAEVNAPTDDGRGGTKACNTVGTATLSGYPEHAFTWDVAVRTRALLEVAGATVTLTREDDAGVGPCVDERGRSAQEHDGDLLVSLHADGSEDPQVRGYFAIVSEPPLNEAQGEPSRALALAMLKALGAAGFTPSSSYAGALSQRPDLGTLNWAERPVVMLELAQMHNAAEAAVLETEEGRQRYAAAIADGVGRWAEER
ncbi:N-acetylmuramoyl-L-alanine amidase [Georgenia yuyongxinii]